VHKTEIYFSVFLLHSFSLNPTEQGIALDRFDLDKNKYEYSFERAKQFVEE